VNVNVNPPFPTANLQTLSFDLKIERRGEKEKDLEAVGRNFFSAQKIANPLRIH
jgi:hypothetical protein